MPTLNVEDLEPETTYRVRLKRTVTALGVVWRACDRNGRPREYDMKGRVVTQLAEHVAHVDVA